MDYDRRLFETYHRARRLSPETGRLWMEIAREHRPGGGVRAVLDLGSGTGRFSPLLADALDALVIGVEPSRKMRTIAIGECRHPQVRLVGGHAEAIPARDRSFDVAWLSMMLHHCTDIAACAREVYRVLRPGGCALVRSSFSGRLESFLCYDFFPSARAIDEDRLPDLKATRDCFESVGFDFQADRPVEQTVDDTPEAYLERMRQRPISTFDLIPESDYEDGIRKMEEAVHGGILQGPVREVIDLLVFERPAEGEEE